ncbi:MAG TPA: cytochrome c oxidase subunit II [Acidimicrobiales bacterium]|nr:cytochrome c oxidase subunit II [Acidimicrobiales bacterium]
MSGRRHRLLKCSGVVLLLLFLVACGSKKTPQNSLSPAGEYARTIDNLIDPVFIVAAVVFVLVEGLALLFVIRYRQRPGPEPVQVHGNTRLEVGWTLVPFLILVTIAVPTIITIFKLADEPPNAVNVTVIGHQWWWEYRYDDLGIVSANELHLPVGRPVQLKLQSVDVIHSYWVPRLNGKTDVVPGRTNHSKLKAERPGTYIGQCTEFCGLSHANMRNRAVAQTPADFDAWVKGQQQAAVAPAANTDAATGMTLFTSKGCTGCHTVQGLSKGAVGPNLTHLYSRSTFAGSMFDLNATELRKWLHDPPGVKPGSKMPNLNLSADEIQKLIAYLETLK